MKRFAASLLFVTFTSFVAATAMAEPAAPEAGAVPTAAGAVIDESQIAPAAGRVEEPAAAPAVEYVPSELPVIGLATDKQLGFQEPVTPVMKKLDQLHDFLTVIAIVTAIFVLLLLGYVCVRFRRKANPVPSKTTHNTLIEIVWTTAPILILVVIAVKSLPLHYEMDRAEKADMTLKVVGNQWFWSYEYPELGGVAFESRIVRDDDKAKEKEVLAGRPRLLAVDNPVVVPVDTTVRVQVTAADVIHAWAMPAFGVKVDAVPGRLNETWFRAEKTGIYYGQCSELCGVDHGFMPISVHVVSKEEYARWSEFAKTKFAAAGEGVAPVVTMASFNR